MRILLVLALVAIAGCQKRDPLFCEMNQADPRCLGGGDGGVDGDGGFVAVGGTVTGKMGGGLVLLDNGGDDKLITSDGPFQFATGVATRYDLRCLGRRAAVESEPELRGRRRQRHGDIRRDRCCRHVQHRVVLRRWHRRRLRQRRAHAPGQRRRRSAVSDERNVQVRDPGRERLAVLGRDQDRHRHGRATSRARPARSATPTSTPWSSTARRARSRSAARSRISTAP